MLLVGCIKGIPYAASGILKGMLWTALVACVVLLWLFFGGRLAKAVSRAGSSEFPSKYENT